jgi:hypothetical protein
VEIRKKKKAEYLAKKRGKLACVSELEMENIPPPSDNLGMNTPISLVKVRLLICIIFLNGNQFTQMFSILSDACQRARRRYKYKCLHGPLQ